MLARLIFALLTFLSYTICSLLSKLQSMLVYVVELGGIAALFILS